MRIIEILLPKNISDKSLSPQVSKKIDALQTRMNTYVDKIADTKMSVTKRDFLKARLQDDYDELKGVFKKVQEDAIPLEPPVNLASEQYEVYDRQTGYKVGGPYSSRKRASGVADKKDNEYGAYRYGVRLAKAKVTEAVHKLPLSTEDFDLVKQLMNSPIPAIVAPMYISEVIIDDALNDEFRSLEDSDPGRDVRPIIAEWFSRVMPDQMHMFVKDDADKSQAKGLLSPIHGYDEKSNKSSNPDVSGNAFGRF